MVADLVSDARRPAIIAGRGAVLAGARAPLEDLGERIGAVLATSANGNGLFAGSPFAVGISGGFASPLAAELLGQADVLLAFGASLNMWTTRHGALIGPRTRVVQVDTDPEALGRIRPVDLAVMADAAEAARAIAAELDRRGVQGAGYRSPELATRIAAGRWNDEPYEDASSEDTIDPRTLSRELDRVLPADRTLAIDSGHFMGWPAMYLSVPDADGFVFNQSYQSVGLGLGAAIGAAIARPDRLAVAALGDGGALMALGELETAARLRLPLLIVIYNDAAYGAEVHHFGPSGHALDTVRFPDTDFAALARAAGGHGVTVRRTDDLAAVATWLDDRDRPLVVDAKVTPDVVAEWLEEAFRAH
jgi:thiamine pyrophosphate-dependent acetolactate synthase large subunit-like protein